MVSTEFRQDREWEERDLTISADKKETGEKYNEEQVGDEGRRGMWKIVKKMSMSWEWIGNNSYNTEEEEQEA
jgi:hypothetical protein